MTNKIFDSEIAQKIDKFMKLPSHDLWLGYVYRYDANLFKNFENVFIMKAKMH